MNRSKELSKDGSIIQSLVKFFISSLNFPKRKLFPDPHLAYNPTVMGIASDGSVKILAKELL